MSPGHIVRKILGPAFKPIGEIYRRIFVDMAKVADWFAGHLPPNARVLDIGGGDGYMVNMLLERRPDIAVTMTDIASQIGSFIEARHLPRVKLLAGTDADLVEGGFDVITLADVVHHVPVSRREGFFAMLRGVADRTGAKSILIKDIRPGSFRATLSLLSDIYITRDTGVSLVAETDIGIPGFRQTDRAMPDFPNYCIAFGAERGAAG